MKFTSTTATIATIIATTAVVSALTSKDADMMVQALQKAQEMLTPELVEQVEGAMHNPEVQEEMKAAMQNPKVQEEIKAAKQDPEGEEELKAFMQDPKVQEQMKAEIQRPEFAETIKADMQDPKQLEVFKVAMQIPKVRKIIEDGIRGKSPEERKKIVEAFENVDLTDDKMKDAVNAVKAAAKKADKDNGASFISVSLIGTTLTLALSAIAMF